MSITVHNSYPIRKQASIFKLIVQFRSTTFNRSNNSQLKLFSLKIENMRNCKTLQYSIFVKDQISIPKKSKKYYSRRKHDRKSYEGVLRYKIA